MKRLLETGSAQSIVNELAATGFRTKLRPLRNGAGVVGMPFSQTLRPCP